MWARPFFWICRRLQQRGVSKDCGVLRSQRGLLDFHCAHADSKGSVPDGSVDGSYCSSLSQTYLLCNKHHTAYWFRVHCYLTWWDTLYLCKVNPCISSPSNYFFLFYNQTNIKMYLFVHTSKSLVHVRLSQGQLCVIGGSNGHSDELSCGEMYDPHADEWVQVSELRTNRCNAGQSTGTSRGLIMNLKCKLG